MPKKRPLLFFILVTLSFLLMSYQNKNGRIVSGDFLLYITDTAQMAGKAVADTLTGPFKKIALREEENLRLQKKVEELMLERSQYQDVIAENRRLRALLSFRETRQDYIATAEVLSRGTDNWANIILIDKGLKDGVQKDMAVITPKGLLGKVISSSDSYSRVLLITSINFSAAVRVQDSRKEGIVSGKGSGKCLLKYVPFEEEVKVGDVIITSGLDSFYPPGVPVGYVVKVDNKETSGQFQNIEVIPYQDDTKMEEVIIVK